MTPDVNPANDKQTRVGEGIFKSEDKGEAGQKLQQIGREWGVSTGRKRRCGWLDLVVLKYSASVNYYTAWNLTSMSPSLRKVRVGLVANRITQSSMSSILSPPSRLRSRTRTPTPARSLNTSRLTSATSRDARLSTRSSRAGKRRRPR